ncbi:Outer dense fiber protein 2 [Paragonimus kellicotti]|nr:Outer dense fiber protein 2 [Paragonimus kellicotti]
MTKGIVKLEGRHDAKNGSKSPIHLHISEDAPVHLHFEPESRKSGAIAEHYKTDSDEMYNASKQKPTGVSLQTPWVPPPAKTSTGRFTNATKDNSCRRVRIMGKRCGGSTLSLHSDPEVLKEERCKQPVDKNEAYVYHRDTASREMTTGDHRSELNGVTESIRLAGETAQLGDQADNFKQSPQDLDGGTLWTTNVLEEWLRDIDDSMTHVAKAVRNLEECLDEIVFEGRRLTSRDLNRLNQPRDDLVLHADVAVRAGRELCRWAASANRQQERYLARKLDQTQSKEHELASEIRQLKEKLQRATFELEQKQRLLTERQNEGMKFNTVNESLETVKGHLQRELRQRDSECSRLSNQIRNLESRSAEERATLRTRLDVAEANLEQMYQTKNALKRAARAQKKRADEAEQALAEALERLKAKEAMVTHLQTRCERNESHASTRDRTSSEERKEDHSRSRTQYSVLSEKTPRGESRDVSPASSRRNIPSKRNELEEVKIVILITN